MAKDPVYDKGIVRNMVIGCVVAILIFNFAWLSKFTHNLSNWFFTLVYGLLLGAFVIEAIGAIRYADDDKKRWKRFVALALAVALCAWLGGWAAGSNEKKMFEQDVEKAKQVSDIKISPPFPIIVSGYTEGHRKTHKLR